MPNEQERVMKKTLAGVAQAQRDYQNWSAGLSWRRPPEYMFTISVARKLMGIRDRSHSLTLEQQIEEDGPRIDIVLWNGENPISAIEIKKLRIRVERVVEDIERIIGSLHAEPELEYGLAAYYIFNYARHDVSDTMNQIDEQACHMAEIEGFHFCSCRRYIRAFDDIFWSAAVLKIAREG